jgi:mannose-6-phosphate isomerase-like protein (cupin superfamily)
MRMTLAPGEVFEHAHSTDSVTTLIEGSVELLVDDTVTALVVGVPTTIPASVSHVLRNVGARPAVIDCLHTAGRPPQ